MPELSLLTLNIANPSPERAERQLGWLAARDEDVLVLTETKDSAGCRLLADAFIVAGYHVSYPRPDHGDYGVMIVSRIQARPDYFGDRVGYLASRAAAITLPTASGPIQVIGAYVPSRDASVEKTERKRKWLDPAINPARQLTDIRAVLPATGKIQSGELHCSMRIQPSPASQTYTVCLRYQTRRRPHVTGIDPQLTLHTQGAGPAIFLPLETSCVCTTPASGATTCLSVV
jgi:exonuclease III